MTEEFMKRPTDVLLMAVGAMSQEEMSAFRLGRMAMGLELITVIRSLEGIPALDEGMTAAVVASLETLLVDQRLTDAYTLYDVLSASRRPVFVPVPEHEDIADASDSHELDQEREFDADASLDEGLEDAPSPVDGIRQLLRERQSLDEDPTTEPSDSDEGEAQEESSE